MTELATGLGMLGHGSVDVALAARPPTMVSVAPETWDRLARLRAGGAEDASFAAAFANGAAFLRAHDGLRGRTPATIEWKGSQRAPGDEVAPVDLRIDHVYLVSCKYLSKILVNASPGHLFEDLLAGRQGRRRTDWFAAVATAEYEALYAAVRRGLGHPSLPSSPSDLGPDQRARLSAALSTGWPGESGPAYRALVAAVSRASASRWSAALSGPVEREAMLWRLLRMGPAPYFVLGTAHDRPLRLRVATPWDWRQGFRLRAFDVAPGAGGQPLVTWRAVVRDRRRGIDRVVAGHVEVRWGHGRFGGQPEAKAYLDTPHRAVPGYLPLDPTDDDAAVTDEEGGDRPPTLW